MNVAEPKTKTDKQREELIEVVKALPVESLQELAIFLQYLKYKAGSAERERPSDAKPSPYESFKEAGLIGCIKDAPPDLSVNYKKYLAEGLTEPHDHR